MCVCGAACPLDNKLIVKSGEARKSPLLLQGAIGDLKPNEINRIHQPFLSSHFLSKATVRPLHDHKSIL